MQTPKTRILALAVAVPLSFAGVSLVQAGDGGSVTGTGSSAGAKGAMTSPNSDAGISTSVGGATTTDAGRSSSMMSGEKANTVGGGRGTGADARGGASGAADR
jgi:hypothetical protein